MEYVSLTNGVKMPILGYGCFLLSPEETGRCVREAIEVGYRSIDTAQIYYNEEGVGAAVKTCGLPREELFLTTKVWITNAGYERAKASIEESLNKLQTDYIDLLLVHQPFNDYYGSWRAMEDAYKAGKLRAIGVSNFYPDRLLDLASFSEIPPMVNQLETHLFQQHREDRELMEKYGVRLEAWSPFARGGNGLLTNPILTEIAAKYGKAAGQTALRFLIQSGIIAIPKSSRRERMAENLDIFDFALSPEEMTRLEALDGGKNLFVNHREPSHIEDLFARFNVK